MANSEQPRALALFTDWNDQREAIDEFLTRLREGTMHEHPGVLSFYGADYDTEHDEITLPATDIIVLKIRRHRIVRWLGNDDCCGEVNSYSIVRFFIEAIRPVILIVAEHDRALWFLLNLLVSKNPALRRTGMPEEIRRTVHTHPPEHHTHHLPEPSSHEKRELDRLRLDYKKDINTAELSASFYESNLHSRPEPGVLSGWHDRLTRSAAIVEFRDPEHKKVVREAFAELANLSVGQQGATVPELLQHWDRLFDPFNDLNSVDYGEMIETGRDILDGLAEVKTRAKEFDKQHGTDNPNLSDGKISISDSVRRVVSEIEIRVASRIESIVNDLPVRTEDPIESQLRSFYEKNQSAEIGNLQKKTSDAQLKLEKSEKKTADQEKRVTLDEKLSQDMQETLDGEKPSEDVLSNISKTAEALPDAQQKLTELQQDWEARDTSDQDAADELRESLDEARERVAFLESLDDFTRSKDVEKNLEALQSHQTQLDERLQKSKDNLNKQQVSEKNNREVADKFEQELDGLQSDFSSKLDSHVQAIDALQGNMSKEWRSAREELLDKLKKIRPRESANAKKVKELRSNLKSAFNMDLSKALDKHAAGTAKPGIGEHSTLGDLQPLLDRANQAKYIIDTYETHMNLSFRLAESADRHLSALQVEFSSVFGALRAALASDCLYYYRVVTGGFSGGQARMASR